MSFISHADLTFKGIEPSSWLKAFSGEGLLFRDNITAGCFGLSNVNPHPQSTFLEQ